MRTYNNSIVIKFDTTATGNAGAGKPVTVYEVGTVTKAELFNSAEQAITNPINADNEGNYSFKVANGIYDIVIDQGLPTQVKIENELITDAAGGGSGSSAIETIELTSGQVLVQFTVNTEGASFYINGTGADNGRILESVNYSYNQSLNQVTLTNSYPSGTYISAIRDTGYINEDYVRYFDELSDAVTSTKLADGDKIYLEERTAGNGGGGMWDVVLASTVTPNAFDIVACTGVPTLALKKIVPFEGGIQYKTDIDDTRSCIDWAHYSQQGGSSPIALALHDYTDANRSLQLDKVGGNNSQYILGLRRGNNDIRRPDLSPTYVAGAGYLECSFDDFSGAGGSKLVNKAFFIGDDANLYWTGKNGTADNSAQLVSGIPNGEGKFPFVFTATGEEDLFMKFANPSGNLFTIRDQVAGTRTTFTTDSNQTNGFRLETLAGGIDLDPANDAITVRGDVNGETGRDTAFQAVGATLTLGGTAILADAPFKMKQYSVASAPNAAQFTGHAIYVSNGDSGSPCLAVSDGTDWKRIALGSAITA